MTVMNVFSNQKERLFSLQAALRELFAIVTSSASFLIIVCPLGSARVDPALKLVRLLLDFIQLLKKRAHGMKSRPHLADAVIKHGTLHCFQDECHESVVWSERAEQTLSRCS
jgi:hypothetical protein